MDVKSARTSDAGKVCTMDVETCCTKSAGFSQGGAESVRKMDHRKSCTMDVESLRTNHVETRGMRFAGPAPRTSKVRTRIVSKRQGRLKAAYARLDFLALRILRLVDVHGNARNTEPLAKMHVETYCTRWVQTIPL